MMSTGPSAAALRGRRGGGGRAAALLEISCDGHGGSSARQAAGDRPTHVEHGASQNGLERGMKGGIIMARH